MLWFYSFLSFLSLKDFNLQLYVFSSGTFEQGNNFVRPHLDGRFFLSLSLSLSCLLYRLDVFLNVCFISFPTFLSSFCSCLFISGYASLYFCLLSFYFCLCLSISVSCLSFALYSILYLT